MKKIIAQLIFILLFACHAPDNKKPTARIDSIAPIFIYGQATLDAHLSMDPDGKIVKWKWTQISGPTKAVLNNVDSPICYADGLIQGYYDFLITVTDDSAATASKKVVVAVGPPPTK